MTTAVNIRAQLNTPKDCQKDGMTMHLINVKDRKKQMYVKSFCKGWGCVSCRPALQSKWLEHLRRVVLSLSEVYTLRGSKGQQDAIARRVTRAGGQYVSLELPGGILVFVANVVASGFHEVTKVAALTLLSETMKLVVNRKPIHTSRGWELVSSETDKTSEWEKVDTAKVSIDEIARLAVDLKLPVSHFWGERSAGIIVELPADWDEADNVFIRAISGSGGKV